MINSDTIQASIWTEVGPVKLPLRLYDDSVVEFSSCYYETSQGIYVVLAIGEPQKEPPPLVRVQSVCSYAHLFGSQLCDCEWQLEESKRRVADSKCGLILFAVEQHGKGVGLKNHFLIYSEGQKRGLELVVDAYRALGFKEDYREYGGAGAILKSRGVRKVRLLTNSPRKVEVMEALGFEVERVELEMPLNIYNRMELTVKREKLGHLLSLNVSDSKRS